MLFILSLVGLFLLLLGLSIFFYLENHFDIFAPFIFLSLIAAVFVIGSIKDYEDKETEETIYDSGYRQGHLDALKWCDSIISEKVN